MIKTRNKWTCIRKGLIHKTAHSPKKTPDSESKGDVEMRTLSLMKILALLGVALFGLDTSIGADPCDDPSNGVQENILGIVEVYDLGYHMNSYTQSSHRMTIENRTDAAVE